MDRQQMKRMLYVLTEDEAVDNPDIDLVEAHQEDNEWVDNMNDDDVESISNIGQLYDIRSAYLNAERLAYNKMMREQS